MDDLSRILRTIGQGDPGAADRLLPLVYDELRSLAAGRLARERPGQTLQPTALVHEAYLRLVGLAGVGAARWEGRGHFFAAAAEAMRRILVDSARRKAALKRGGFRAEIDPDNLAASDDRPDEVLAVNEALDRLAEVDPKAAELVKLRYFAGLTMPEAAVALGVSLRSAERTWAYARAWLRRAIEGA